MSDRLALDPDDLEDEPEEAGGSRPKRKPGSEPAGARGRRKREANLRGRIETVLSSLADWLDERGDGELARVIREDAGAMTRGVVSLTRPFAWLVQPITWLLAIAEPTLAFGRVFRVLVVRWSDRRERIAVEREQAAAEAEAQAVPDLPAPEPEPETAEPWRLT